MLVEVHSNGFIIKNLNQQINQSLEKAKPKRFARGSINGFSRKSSKRLKDLLMRLDNTNVVSITLTLPCKPVGMYRDLWHRFAMNYTRAFPSGWLIWRIELQRRGIPHWHCVARLDTLDDIGLVWELWLNALGCLANLDGAMLYSASFKFLRGVGWYKYLALHTGKHKSCQLGWRGRQWGVIGRLHLPLVGGVVYDARSSLQARLIRVLRWLCRYRSLDFDFFGSRVLYVPEEFKSRIEQKYLLPLGDKLPF